MSSIILTFLLGLLLSIGFTPAVRYLARRWHLMDEPNARKVHVETMPRAGGVVIYGAFMIAFLSVVALHAGPLNTFDLDRRTVALLIGGSLAFAVGLWDDVRALQPAWKLAAHIGCGLIAYAGGIEIVKVTGPGFAQVELGWLALPATIVWFVLIINALNLIDGLDGLAAGISLFTALILLVVLDSTGRFLVAIGLAALAGACLGFLRHNFHPASIFLGDSGSYFLGYNLAALSVLGSVKSETTVAILIPIIALGVPVIDALWAPLRRFILGQRLFTPDRDHIHHRLLKMGYTHRRAVLLLYAITILMGLVALSLVHARDDRAALILAVVGVGAFIGIRKLGYLAFIHRQRVVGWIAMVGDDLGLRRNRRSFLECQEAIAQSTSLSELRTAVATAAQFLELDSCELTVTDCETCGSELCSVPHNGAAWQAAGGDPNRTLHVSLPLEHQGARIGCLKVSRAMNNGDGNPYLLRRIDQLCGTIAETLHHLHDTHHAPRADGELHGTFGNGRRRAARVLFLTHYFPPEGNAPAARVHAVCKDWVRRGQQVTVITCAPNVPDGVVYDGYSNRLYQKETIDGIETIRVWTYLAANKGTGLRILNYLTYLVAALAAALSVKKPDVIIATSPQFFCGWAGVIASRLRGVPFILEIRDLWPASIATLGAMRNRRLLRLLEWLEVKMYAAARQIVTVGEGYRDELCKRGVPPARVTVIPNGVDRELFFPRAPAPQLRARWAPQARVVCAYVGTVGMACGLDVLLRAGQQLQSMGRTDIAFLVVGEGAARADLEREAAGAGLGNIIFTGRQSKALIPPLLASVDVCLVHLKKRPLFTTVMPSKIFEAAAMAKPIILGVQGHAADLVARAACGICIEPENETELVAALLRLADDRELAATLGWRGYDFFVERFDRGALASRYLELVHRVCAQATAGTDSHRDEIHRLGPPSRRSEASVLPSVVHADASSEVVAPPSTGIQASG